MSSYSINPFIEAKIDKLLLMMQRCEKYGATTSVDQGGAIILFSQDYTDAVETKRMLVETGRLPTKTEMLRMNDIYKDIKMSEGTLVNEIYQYVIDHWDQNNHNMIEAIKDIRHKYGLGLKEAKDVTDRCKAKGLIVP